MTRHFKYHGLQFEYLTYGSGAEVVFCFHGFGRHASDFSIFRPLLRPGQQIISINLFAHHGSVFPADRIENKPLEPGEWKDMLMAFCRNHAIAKFHLAGYSMGGRVCLKTLEIMPEFVRSILLIAPDGFKVNPLYRFASGTALGRSLYRRLIDQPAPLFRMADMLKRAGILNEKLHKFVYVHLDTKQRRQLVHDAWLIYRKFFPETKKLALLIRNRKIPFNMIFGKNDSVIRPELGKKFTQLLQDESHLHIIDAGHRLLNDATVKFIAMRDLWMK